MWSRGLSSYALFCCAVRVKGSPEARRRDCRAPSSSTTKEGVGRQAPTPHIYIEYIYICMYIYYIYISIYIGIYYVRVVRNAVVVVERGLVRQQQRKNGSYFTHVYI